MPRNYSTPGRRLGGSGAIPCGFASFGIAGPVTAPAGSSMRRRCMLYRHHAGFIKHSAVWCLPQELRCRLFSFESSRVRPALVLSQVAAAYCMTVGPCRTARPGCRARHGRPGLKCQAHAHHGPGCQLSQPALCHIQALPDAENNSHHFWCWCEFVTWN